MRNSLRELEDEEGQKKKYKEDLDSRHPTIFSILISTLIYNHHHIHSTPLSQLSKHKHSLLNTNHHHLSRCSSSPSPSSPPAPWLLSALPASSPTLCAVPPTSSTSLALTARPLPSPSTLAPSSRLTVPARAPSLFAALLPWPTRLSCARRPSAPSKAMACFTAGSL